MLASKVLEKARNLIYHQSRWTKNTMARDANGGDVDDTSPRATCWCSLGAVNRAAYELTDSYSWMARDIEASAAKEALRYTLHALHGDDRIAVFNDTHTHAEVLNLFDETINRLKGLGQ